LGVIDGSFHDGSLGKADLFGDGTTQADTTATSAFDYAFGASGGTYYVDESGNVFDGSTAGTPALLGHVTDNGDGSFTVTDTSGDFAGRIDTNEQPQAPGTEYSTELANADLDNLASYIDEISTFRSQIGAVQNQLTYTVDNLSTAITNVTASRSNLTDADLAEE